MEIRKRLYSLRSITSKRRADEDPPGSTKRSSKKDSKRNQGSVDAGPSSPIQRMDVDESMMQSSMEAGQPAYASSSQDRGFEDPSTSHQTNVLEENSTPSGISGKQITDILVRQERSSRFRIKSKSREDLETELQNLKCIFEEVNEDRNKMVADRDGLQRAFTMGKEHLETTIRSQSVSLQHKEGEIFDLKAELEQARRARAELKQVVYQLEGQLRGAMDGERKASNRVEELRHRTSATEKLLEKSQKVLKDQTEELTVAQAFMTTADQFSGADISRKVEQLNDDIYQCAAFIADSVLQAKEHGGEVGDDLSEEGLYQEYRSNVVGRWGEHLVSRLQVDIAQDDTVLFEAMIQNAFVVYCDEIVWSLYLGDRKIADCLYNLWLGISDSYQPSISRNWLSMTHTQLKNHEIDESVVIKHLEGLMVVAGWREQRGEFRDKFFMNVRGKVIDIIGGARKVKEMVFEGVLSADARTFLWGNGYLYDPTVMQDAYDTGRAADNAALVGQPIVCSTAMGLQYVVTVQRTSSSSRGKEIILKPKVLLASALEVM